MSHTVEWNRHLCTIHYTGEVNYAEFFRAILSIHEHEDYDRVDGVLHDMTEVDRLNFDGVNMTELASYEMGAHFTNPTLRAAVASHDRNMALMTITFREITHVAVEHFTNVEEAIEWIKMKPSTSPFVSVHLARVQGMLPVTSR